jgi:propanediol dehydratase small subunit
VGFDPVTDYPLGSRRPDLLTTPRGLPLADVTLEAARQGRVTAGDLSATGETLARQAAVARAHGRTQLAENLERAAELTALGEDEVMAVYTALRPGRSSAPDLERWAEVLDGRGATRTSAFVREAAAVYAERGLLHG